MNLKKRYAGGLLSRILIVPFCLAMVLLVSAKLQAQETGAASAPIRLTPEQAVELAEKNNLSLESTRIDVATRRRASDLSWNQFIPNVTAAGVLNRDNQANTISGMEPTIDIASLLPPGLVPPPYDSIISQIPPGSTYVVHPWSVEAPRWSIAANVQASVNINVAMFENMKRLRLDYETGLLSYEKAKAQLERDVRKAYHNILLLQENLALMQHSFENVERQVEMARANYNAGLAPELVLLQAQVARENMRPIIDQVENGLSLSMMQFAFFLGLPFDTQFELIPVATDSIDFIPLDVVEMISKAASGKPDIQELRHTILMLESVRKAQVYSLTPTLMLGWGNTWALSDPFNDSQFRKDGFRNVGGAFSITLALQLHSLFPFSANFQGIRNIEDQIRIANIGLGQMIRGTEIEIYNTVLALERTRVNTEAQIQTVRLAEQSFRLTEQAYRAGLQDYFQVQNAEQSLHQARVQLLEQQFNYLNGLIDLEYSIGVPFGTLSTRSN